MGRLRKVNVNFKLAENKKIPFTIIDGGKSGRRSVQMNSSEEKYGYAVDVALICMYVQEGQEIKLPTFSYSDIASSNEYKEWQKQFFNLKDSMASWWSLYEKLRSMKQLCDMDMVTADMGSIMKVVDKVIEAIEDKDEDDYATYSNKFPKKVGNLVNDITSTANILDGLLDDLNKESQRITDENKMLVSLTNSTAKLTENQQKQLDGLQQKIDSYYAERKADIAGAVTTGVIAGAFIAGGILSFIFVPGAGVLLGFSCLIAGGLVGVATGICSARAAELKKAIDAANATMDNVEKEKAALYIIGQQFNHLAGQMEVLKDAVDDIAENWKGIRTCAGNIRTAAEALAKKSIEEADIDIWKSIKSDLEGIGKIAESIEEGVDSLTGQIKVYLECDLSGCTTKEQIEQKLKEYAASINSENKVS